MPNCALTQSFNLSCDDIGIGGVKEVYFMELENITTITESSGVVTAITKASGKTFKKYQLTQQTANFGEDFTGNRENGTLFFGQRGVVVINKQRVNVRNEILLLSKTNLVAIVKDNVGNYKLYGREYGLRMLTGTAETGTAWGDRNGYTLNFSGAEIEPAPFVQESVISTLTT